MTIDQLKVELVINEFNLKNSDSVKTTLELLNQRAMLKDMLIDALSQAVSELKAAA